MIEFMNKLIGIMAILFNGVVMSHYAHFNLSPVTQITMQQTLRTLAFIAGLIQIYYKVLMGLLMCLCFRDLCFRISRFSDFQFQNEIRNRTHYLEYNIVFDRKGI
jgi:hypothetical protein